MFKFNVFTLFPELYPGPFGNSIMGQAIKSGLIAINVIDIKNYGFGKHNILDDKVYGGGSGMLMRPDVLSDALSDNISDPFNSHIVCMSAKGRLFDSQMSSNLAVINELSIICPRYEGVDQRVLDFYNITEISIGNFVISNGDISCFTIMDSISRNIPGVLGDNDSLNEESFILEDGFLEYPHYTKPPSWNDIDVPEVLLSGHHKNIARWRNEQSLNVTKSNRPDLLKK